MNEKTIKILSSSWFLWVVKAMIIGSALFFAYQVRFDFSVPEEYYRGFRASLGVVLFIKLIVFWHFGLTHGWWRYVSLSDVMTIFKANLVASVGFLLYAVFVRHMEGIPRSILILDGVLCFLVMCGVRFATRAFRENYLPLGKKDRQAVIRTLVIGAGDAGQMLAREVRQNPRLGRKIVGFVDDDPHKRKRKFQGIPVLGSIEKMLAICHRDRIDEIVIAIPSASSKELRRVIEACEETGVHFKTLPGVETLLSDKVSFNLVREVKLEDLLGRKSVKLEVERIRSYLADKCILVTGAAGSIGSEICRQVAKFSPDRIVLFDQAETPLFYIGNELSARFPEMDIVSVIGDVRDRRRLEQIFHECHPQVVFHAAAYKHVVMMENNPLEAIRTNVFGTKTLADVAQRYGVLRFVMVSTDKAVHPANVMGATKRAAELYVQNLPDHDGSTRFVTVRFGNVLGSSGSVVPIFREQIEKGGPVTVTDPEVTRFFMTIPEATQLVLQAGSMGHGGEIFLLEMGKPLKILTLAEELIRLTGKTPYEDIDIIFTGLRLGEKLHEELLLDEEGVLPTEHDKILIAKDPNSNRKDPASLYRKLEKALEHSDLRSAIDVLRQIVPSFDYHGGGAESRMHMNRIEHYEAGGTALPNKNAPAV